MSEYVYTPFNLKSFAKIEEFIKSDVAELLSKERFLNAIDKNDFNNYDDFWDYCACKGLELNNLISTFFNVLEKSCIDVNDPKVFDTFFGKSYKYGKLFLFLVANYSDDDEMFRKHVEYYGYNFNDFNVCNDDLIDEFLNLLEK